MEQFDVDWYIVEVFDPDSNSKITTSALAWSEEDAMTASRNNGWIPIKAWKDVEGQ